MEFNKWSIMYDCMYCKKKLTFDKTKIVNHFKSGCRKIKKNCTHTLLIQATRYSCHVYLNKKNCHLDVKKDILPLVRWPDAVNYFTTTNDWKTLHLIDSDGSSTDSDEDS